MTGIPEKDNKGNGAEEIIKEMIEENFPERKKDSGLEIVSAYQVPSKIDEKRLTPRNLGIPRIKKKNQSSRKRRENLQRNKNQIDSRLIGYSGC